MFFCVFPSMNTADCAWWGRKFTCRSIGIVGIGETGNNVGCDRKLGKYQLSQYTTFSISKELSCRQYEVFQTSSIIDKSQKVSLCHGSQTDLLLAPGFSSPPLVSNSVSQRWELLRVWHSFMSMSWVPGCMLEGAENKLDDICLWKHQPSQDEVKQRSNQWLGQRQKHCLVRC